MNKGEYMYYKEVYGRRILSNCLPPIKYSVNNRNTISITEDIGVVKYTTGKNTPGAKRFHKFLQEHGALEDFILKAFTVRATSDVRHGEKVLIGSWISGAFIWDNPANWGRLHRLWNETLPSRYRGDRYL